MRRDETEPEGQAGSIPASVSLDVALEAVPHVFLEAFLGEPILLER